MTEVVEVVDVSHPVVVAEPRASQVPPGEKSTHIWNPKDCAPGRYLCGKRMSATRRRGVYGSWCPLCVSIRKGELDA